MLGLLAAAVGFGLLTVWAVVVGGALGLGCAAVVWLAVAALLVDPEAF